MKRLLFVISHINKSNNLEWFFEELVKLEKINSRIILLGKGETSFENKLRSFGFKVSVFKQAGKVDFALNWLRCFFFQLIWRPQIIHTHLREATLIGITTSWILRIKKRIYTRHTANYNHIYHPKSVWIDKLINRLSTTIISISNNVSNILKSEGVFESKIALIHHGFRHSAFQNIDDHRIAEIKKKYGIQEGFVIGVVSRYIHWKGYQYIIPALDQIKQKIPEAKFVFANTSGPDSKMIEDLLKKHNLKSEVTQIQFEEDVYALFKCFNLFIHAPISPEVEAFGQIYVESQLLGIPSIVTMSGVAPEFIKHKENAFVVPHKSIDAIAKAVIEMFENLGLREALSSKAMNMAQQKFVMNEMIEEHLKLYLND